MSIRSGLQQQEHTANAKQNLQAAPFFQSKLTINQPDDVYEQEADAVADKVMRMPEASPALTDNKPFFAPPTVNINSVATTKEEPLKKEIQEETEEPLPEIPARLSFDALPPPPDDKKTNEAALVQRKCSHCEEEEKKMQRKEINGNATVAGSTTENYIGSLNGKGRSLSQQERKFFEPRMGYDFSNVQLHTNSNANQSAKSVNALAYTHGNNIVFGSEQYQPDTDEGKKLMAHELTHVVQQKNITNTIFPKKKDQAIAGSKRDEKLSAKKNDVVSENLINKEDNKARHAESHKEHPASGKKKHSDNIAVQKSPAKATQAKTHPEAKAKPGIKASDKPVVAAKTLSVTKPKIKNDDLTIPRDNLAEAEQFSAFNITVKSIKQYSIDLTNTYSDTIETKSNNLLGKISTDTANKLKEIDKYFILQEAGLQAEKLSKRLQLEQERANQKKGLHNNFQIQFDSVLKEYSGEKDELKSEESSQTEDITKYSQQQATLMQSITRPNVSAVLQIGRDVAKKYEHVYNSDEIYNMAMDSAIDGAIKIKEQGKQTEEAIIKDGNSVSDEINKSLLKAQRTLDDMYIQTQSTLQSAYKQSSDKIDEIINQAQSKIDEAYNPLLEQLPVIWQNTVNSVHTIYQGFTNTFLHFNLKLHNAIKTAGASHVFQIQSSAQSILTKATDNHLSQKGLATYLEKSAPDLQQMNLSFEQALISNLPLFLRVSSFLGDLMIQDTEQIQSTGIVQVDFLKITTNNSVLKMIAETSKQVSEVATQGREAFNKTSQAFSDKSNDLVTNVKTHVAELISNSKSAINEKVVKETAAQAEQVSELKQKIEENADDLDYSGAASAILHTIGDSLLSIVKGIAGFVWGVFKAILKLIVGIVILIVAVVVAIVLIIVAVIAVFAALVLIFGAEIALMVAAIVGIVLVCIVALAAVVFIIYGIVMTVVSIVKNLYKAFTDKSISAFDRGELIGESVTDIVILLLPLKGKISAPALGEEGSRGLLGAGEEASSAAQDAASSAAKEIPKIDTEPKVQSDPTSGPEPEPKPELKPEPKLPEPKEEHKIPELKDDPKLPKQEPESKPPETKPETALKVKRVRKATVEEANKIERIRKNSKPKIDKSQNVAYVEGEIDGKPRDSWARSGKRPGKIDPTEAKPKPFEDQELPSRPTKRDIAKDIERGQETQPDRRAYDSEKTILEEILDDTTPESTGSIKIVSERNICESCTDAITEFEAKRPNIRVERVSTEKP